MAIKFLREIVVSSLATALVTAVYTHGPDLARIGEPAAAPPVKPAAFVDEKEQRPEDLAQFMQRVASGHVGRSSPRSPIAQATPSAAAHSTDSEPVWPSQPTAAARPAPSARLVAAARPATPPVAASVMPTTPVTAAAEPTPVASPEQAEAQPANNASWRIVDRFKDYVWNPSASVVSGVTNGVSAVTNKISSFVKRQPS